MHPGSSPKGEWYLIKNTREIVSPALLVYPTRIEENIQRMISISKGVSTLRPHIKTHKTAEIISMQQRHGIQKFKCATIAEAELLGHCKAKDILLAMQPVGINLQRFFKLISTYPNSCFSTLVDNQHTLHKISELAHQTGIIVNLYVDINNGMNRTGCALIEEAVALYKAMENDKNIFAAGLHAYDGHIHNTDVVDRTIACDHAFELVDNVCSSLKAIGIHVPNIVAGGSPSFPIHSTRDGVETSPGTTLLWDEQYAQQFPDMAFLPAAVLLIRIISKPKKDTLCFDLGHKAVACEMPLPRVRILGLEDSIQLSQSEEHLVVKSTRAHEFKVGDCCYAIPMHICPTVAKYKDVLPVLDGKISGRWKVAARNTSIEI